MAVFSGIDALMDGANLMPLGVKLRLRFRLLSAGPPG
jgi:hypothetical protein